jgi:hypothetical protein
VPEVKGPRPVRFQLKRRALIGVVRIGRRFCREVCLDRHRRRLPLGAGKSIAPYFAGAKKRMGGASAATPGDRVASVLSAAADFFWSVIDFLQRYSGAVTAGATVAIGLFTFFLINVTNRQARLTRKSIDLARQGFIATHRPKIKIHAVEIVDREVDGETFIGVSILAFNIGETAAKNVEVRGQIFMAPGFVLDAQRPLVKTFDEVLSGQKLRAEITSDYRASYAAASRRTGNLLPRLDTLLG